MKKPSRPTSSPILLIRPPSRHLKKEIDFDIPHAPPYLDLGLATIAAYTEEKLQMPCYVHCSADHSIQTMAHLVKSQRPRFIGISCLSFNRFACIELAHLAKTIDPSITVIFGGIHATYLDRQMLTTYPDIDYIVRGEGELTFCELIRALLNQNDISTIKGITFRRNGSAIRSPERPRIMNLNSLPLINYKKFFEDPLHLKIRKVSPSATDADPLKNSFKTRTNTIFVDGQLDEKQWSFKLPRDIVLQSIPVEITRGCPFKCLFCSSVGLWGKTTVAKSIDRVLEQLALVPQEYRHIINFHDLTFTLDKNHIQNLCQIFIKKRLDIKWACQTRVNLINKEILQTMKNAGCHMILYGIESLSKKILPSIGKNYTPKTAIDNTNLTADMGFRTDVHLIIGFPGETAETIKESLLNSHKLHPDVNLVVHALQIVPGAPLYDIALKEGFDESYWLKDHHEALPLYTNAVALHHLKRWLTLFKKLSNHTPKIEL